MVKTKEAVRERPILFSGDMVRAILAGKKTQTRRLIKGDPIYTPEFVGDRNHSSCPHGAVGDRLWVRETWSATWDGRPVCNLKPSEYDELSRVWYAADNNRPTWAETKWQPSIFMPRWASRITLDITAVRIERLRDISRDDALAEGITEWVQSPECAFESLWEEIHGAGSVEANPWVWVVEFERIEQ